MYYEVYFLEQHLCTLYCCIYDTCTAKRSSRMNKTMNINRAYLRGLRRRVEEENAQGRVVGVKLQTKWQQ